MTDSDVASPTNSVAPVRSTSSPARDIARSESGAVRTDESRIAAYRSFLRAYHDDICGVIEPYLVSLRRCGDYPGGLRLRTSLGNPVPYQRQIPPPEWMDSFSWSIERAGDNIQSGLDDIEPLGPSWDQLWEVWLFVPLGDPAGSFVRVTPGTQTIPSHAFSLEWLQAVLDDLLIRGRKG